MCVCVCVEKACTQKAAEKDHQTKAKLHFICCSILGICSHMSYGRSHMSYGRLLVWGKCNHQTVFAGFEYGSWGIGFGGPPSAMKVPWPLILLATHMRYDQLLGISFI